LLKRVLEIGLCEADNVAPLKHIL